LYIVIFLMYFKTTMSSEEWEDRVHTDDTTSTYSSSSGSDVDIINDPGQESSSSLLTSSSANQPTGESQLHVINLLQPVCISYSILSGTIMVIIMSRAWQLTTRTEGVRNLIFNILEKLKIFWKFKKSF
jgi:hypothetical protein